MKKSLRRWQLEAAEKGNPTMLIWLGKQVLKQSDQQQVVVEQKTTDSEKVNELVSWLKAVKEIK